MKPELTAEPVRAGADPDVGRPQPQTDQQEAVPLVDVDAAEAGRESERAVSQQTAATPAGWNIDAAFASIPAAMTDGRSKFLKILRHALASDISPAMRRKLLRAGDSRCDEMAALSSLVEGAIAQARPAAAAVIGAALAARTVGRSLLEAGVPCGKADREALFSAWLDATRAIVAVRGPEGLRRLLPAAAYLARRPWGVGKSAAEISARTRRVAARIAEEPPRIGACDRPREDARTIDIGAVSRARGITPSSAQRPAELTIPSR